jgi:dUTP pyrophosphatase
MLSRDGMPPLLVRRLTAGAMVPRRADEGSVGYDLHADLSGIEAAEITAHSCAVTVVPTGIAVAVPYGTYGRIAPRSGLAVKHGMQVLAGVVDPSYRGEVKVVLLNADYGPVTIRHGDRVAQLVLERVATPDVFDADTLDETARGAGGFGSTGS